MTTAASATDLVMEMMMNDTAATEPAQVGNEEGWEWMVVEIMGHRKHAGRVREVERFGAKQLRVDVPIKGDPANGWETYHYSGAAIFGYALSDEATVMKINKPYEPSYRLTHQARAEAFDVDEPHHDDDDDFGEDED